MFGIKLFGLALPCLLLTHCAHVEAPSGGKKDNIPPQVKGVYPARNQVLVDVNAKIKVAFTEWMKEDLKANDVQISPPLMGGIKAEMIGPDLVISPYNSLDTGITYNLILSRELQDLRGNPLDLPFNLSFSTGKFIDSLSLSGQVFSSGFKAAPRSTRVGLFPVGSAKRSQYKYLKYLVERDSLTNDSLPRLQQEFPLYLSSADSSGYFNFKGLAKGQYFVAAFNDANQNSIINDDKEAVALYDKVIDLNETTSLEFPLTLATLEKSKFFVEAIEPLGNRFLKLRFNNPIDYKKQSFTLSSGDSLSLKIDSNKVFLKSNQRELIFFFDSLSNGNNYQLDISSIKSSFNESLDSLQRLLPITWQSTPTPLNNGFEYSSVKSGGILYKSEGQIDFEFTNPIDSLMLSDTLTLVGQSDTIVLKSKPINPFKLRIELPADLAKSSNYQIIRYVAPSDSLPKGSRVRLLSFSTPDPLKIGFTRFKNEGKSSSQILIKHIENSYKDSLYIEAGQSQTLGPMPEGAFVVEYYFDKNNDKYRNPGSLDPYQGAELLLQYPDTLSVPRNDTLNINFH